MKLQLKESIYVHFLYFQIQRSYYTDRTVRYLKLYDTVSLEDLATKLLNVLKNIYHLHFELLLSFQNIIQVLRLLMY